MCLRSRGRAEFRRRKSLPPPPAEFWSARQPDLVRASRKSGGGTAEGSRGKASPHAKTLHYCNIQNLHSVKSN